MSSSPSKNAADNSVRKLSEMLLSGWKMLSFHCPMCNCPLVSKDGKMRCPGCDMPVMLESDVGVVDHQNQNDIKEIVDVTEDFEDDDDDAVAESKVHSSSSSVIEPTSLEELKREWDLKHKQRSNDVSSKLGEKMMAGWTMLGQNCPQKDCRGTPFMRKEKNGPLFCVSCESEFQENCYGDIEKINDTGNKRKTEPLSSSSIPVPSSSSSSSPSQFAQSKNEDGSVALLSPYDAPILNFSAANDVNDPSAKIAEKLLKGWAILDETCVEGHCQAGTVPLMRDLENQKRCVVCLHICGQPKSSTGTMKSLRNTNTDTPMISIKNKQVPPIPRSNTSRTARFADNADNADKDNESDDDDDEDDLEDDTFFESYREARVAALEKEKSQPQISSNPISHPSNRKHHAQTLRAQHEEESLYIIDILRRKMTSTATVLDKCDDVEEASKLAILLEKLAIAAKAFA